MSTCEHEGVERILFTQEELARRVTEMGAQITADYAGKDLLVVSVLRGAAILRRWHDKLGRRAHLEGCDVLHRGPPCPHC